MARATPDDVAVRCDDLSVARGGVRVAEGITFTLAPGRALVLMGATGAGKSSLAALLAASDDSSLTVVGGGASVAGISVRKRGRAVRARRVATGYLAQDGGMTLPARSTVSEAIGAPITSRDHRVNQRALDLQIASLLDEMQLPLGAAAKYPYELSSGMRQRVALARALVLEPRVFVGDEPYANLDIEVRRAARDALLRRRDERGMAILVVTNDQAAVRDLDADVLVLRAGHPVGLGHGTDDILWTPDGRARLAS
ncbi:MAG: ATP-binding cassette domain-containing protein [Microbacterium sp.]